MVNLHSHFIKIITIMGFMALLSNAVVPIDPQQLCPAEYYRNSTDTCRFCADDMVACRICTNSTICLACTDQYYLDSGGT